MFDALEVTLQVIERLAPVEAAIRKRNASLAKQLSDASESIALNLGEGRERFAGDQRRHYEMASGSAGGITVALRVALAKRYIDRKQFAEVDALLDRVRAMLYRLAH